MEKISLRGYIHEIETMVDQNRIDEAVNHCRYLLKLYPKFIDIYRVLGKAYLEARRYSESNDVFQRVLSAVPDDFVSHIGMSIIREDEGNLDAAIWHMERAFEVQPSNSIVQEELKRLFGRRDGMQPPKIRLTNGALVRMYYRGELYQQALAELRSAQTDEEERIDLDIIKVKILNQQGLRSDAAEICNKILHRLPYCLEANQILSQILVQENRLDEAGQYQSKVIDLDPYTAFVKEGQNSGSDVPDEAIMIDMLELGEDLTKQDAPSWAATAGVEFTPDAVPLPDWMEDVDRTGIIPESKPNEGISQIDTTEESILTPTMDVENSPGVPAMTGFGDVAEVPVEEIADNIISPIEETGTIQAGEVPDWLRVLEPEEVILEPAADSPAEENLEQLEEILTASITSPEFGMQENDSPGEIQNDKDLSQGNTNDIEPETGSVLSVDEIPSVSNELPEWLRELPSIDEIDSPLKDALPDWLQIEETKNQSRDLGNGSFELPEVEIGSQDEKFEDNLTKETEVSAGDIEASAVFSDDLSSILSENNQQILDEIDTSEEPPVLTPAPSDEVIGEDIVSTEDALLSNHIFAEEKPGVGDISGKVDEDAAFAWLESLAAKQGVDEETLLTPVEELKEISPEWSPEIPQQEHFTDGTQLADDEMELEVFQAASIDDEETSVHAEQGEIVSEQVINELETRDAISEGDISAFEPELPTTILQEVDSTIEPETPIAISAEVESPEDIIGESDIEEEPEVKRELPDWLKDLEKDTTQAEFIDNSDREEGITELESSIPVSEVEFDDSPAIAAHDAGDDEVQASDESFPDDVLDSTAGEEETRIRLEAARNALEEGNILNGLEILREMIEDNKGLDVAIRDIQNALDRHPLDIDLWQTLGDAYAKKGVLQSAIDCYTKAEELLR